MPRATIWNGSISFGLINIPVSLQVAEQSHDLQFHLLDKENLARIRYDRVNSKTGKSVPYSQITKGYEYQKDKYVIMTDADFKKANPKASQTLEIHQFVKEEEIDPMLFVRPYYLMPGKAAQKSYFLFQRALAEKKRAAFGTFVMHEKEHLACLLSREGHLVLELLRFTHAIRYPPEVKTLDQSAKKVKFRSQELEVASQLIDRMTGKWNAKDYRDTFYLDLKKYIDKKIRTGQGKTIHEAETVKSIRNLPAPDTDLMDLLKKSLAQKQPTGKSKHVH